MTSPTLTIADLATFGLTVSIDIAGMLRIRPGSKITAVLRQRIKESRTSLFQEAQAASWEAFETAMKFKPKAVPR